MNFMKSALFAVAAAASLQAFANDPVTHTISLEATVPSSDFFVLPKDNSWINTSQVLSYTASTGNLSSLSKQFEVKHTAGAIEGKLLSTAEITSATGSIDLVVKFNNVVLSTTGTQVVTKANAATTSTVLLDIAPVKPTAGYAPGTYTGNVQLQFDAVI